MSTEDLRRASACPAPTYLIGVDEVGEAAYIFPILADMTKTIFSIPTKYPLDCTNLELLEEEVVRFWASREMSRRTSVFSE